MSTTDTIQIDLSLAEWHVLTDLLRHFIRPRVADAVGMAKNAVEMERGAERARRLAQLEALPWASKATLPLADLDAHRADLVLWAEETDSTTEEHDDMIANGDGHPLSTEKDREDALEPLRNRIMVDYAHRCVCEKIVGQIDAARELVAA